MRKTLFIIAACLAVAMTGCRREEAKVKEGLSSAEFKSQAQQKLAAMDQRAQNLKQQSSDASEATKTTVNNSVEMAQEKIETLRENTLPALDTASEDQADKLKDTVNDQLAAIDKDLKNAEDTLKKETGTGEGTGATGSAQDWQDQTKARLEGLKSERESVEKRLDQAGTAVKDRLKVHTESAEEAIQQAEDNLDKAKDATGEQAQKMRQDIDKLLTQAKENLDKARTELDKQR